MQDHSLADPHMTICDAHETGQAGLDEISPYFIQILKHEIRSLAHKMHRLTFIAGRYDGADMFTGPIPARYCHLHLFLCDVMEIQHITGL